MQKPENTSLGFRVTVWDFEEGHPSQISQESLPTDYAPYTASVGEVLHGAFSSRECFHRKIRRIPGAHHRADWLHWLQINHGRCTMHTIVCSLAYVAKECTRNPGCLSSSEERTEWAISRRSSVGMDPTPGPVALWFELRIAKDSTFLDLGNGTVFRTKMNYGSTQLPSFVYDLFAKSLRSLSVARTIALRFINLLIYPYYWLRIEAQPRRSCVVLETLKFRVMVGREFK